MKLTLGLCKGRHVIPEVDDYIFENTIVDPLDFEAMRRDASYKLSTLVKDSGFIRDISELSLYVTGLTPALTTVIQICIDYRILLNLYHFNRDTGKFVKQRISMNYDY